jgi:hypothetical protein
LESDEPPACITRRNTITDPNQNGHSPAAGHSIILREWADICTREMITNVETSNISFGINSFGIDMRYRVECRLHLTTVTNLQVS